MVLGYSTGREGPELNLSAKLALFTRFFLVATLFLGFGCSASNQAPIEESPSQHSSLLKLDDTGLEVRAIRRDSNVFICWESYGACFHVAQDTDGFYNDNKLRKISTDKYIIDYVERHAPRKSAIVNISIEPQFTE